MADAVVVVEAGWRSGSLNTAAHAATLGRPLGAVPGPITSAASAGCHRILREYGGVCVTSAVDVREMIGGLSDALPLAVSVPGAGAGAGAASGGGAAPGPRARSHGRIPADEGGPGAVRQADDGGASAPDRTDDATRVFDALSVRIGRETEEIARRSGLSPAQVRTQLGFAELAGRVVRDEDGTWRARRS